MCGVRRGEEAAIFPNSQGLTRHFLGGLSRDSSGEDRSSEQVEVIDAAE